MDPNKETGQHGSCSWPPQLQLTPAPGAVLAPYPPPGDGGWCGCTGGASTVSCAGSGPPDGRQLSRAVPQEDVDDEAAPPRAKAPATAPFGEDYEGDEEECEVYDDEEEDEDEDEDEGWKEDTAAAVGTKRVAKLEWDAEGVVLSAEGVVTGVGPGPMSKRPALA